MMYERCETLSVSFGVIPLMNSRVCNFVYLVIYCILVAM